MRGCPAISKRLKGSILTVGGEGTTEKFNGYHCKTVTFLQGLLQHSQLTMTEAAPSPMSLAMTKLGTLGGGLAPARQLKVVLSAVLRGSKVRVLVNDGLEPDTEEIVTLESPLDKRVLPFSQVTSASLTATSVSVAGLMEKVQVRVRGST